MRNNTPDPTDIRWQVLKSMLDDFPQLRGRTEQYLLNSKDLRRISPTDRMDPEVKELMKAIFLPRDTSVKIPGD